MRIKLHVLALALVTVANTLPVTQQSDELSQDCAHNGHLTLLQLHAKALSPAQGGANRTMTPTGNVSDECQEEWMKLNVDQDRARAADVCLQSHGYHAMVISALQNGDKKKATAETAKGFAECANLTKACAQAVAPTIVLNIMMGGTAVEEACWNEITTIQNDEEKMKSKGVCEDKAMKSIVSELDANDVEGAIDVAQKEELEGCLQVSDRCSVQLAPVLVTQIVQAAEEAANQGQQPIKEPQAIPASTTVLFSNMHKASSQHKDSWTVLFALHGARPGKTASSMLSLSAQI